MRAFRTPPLRPRRGRWRREAGNLRTSYPRTAAADSNRTGRGASDVDLERAAAYRDGLACDREHEADVDGVLAHRRDPADVWIEVVRKEPQRHPAVVLEDEPRLGD